MIAFWGRYEEILSYVVSVDFIFFGLTALCLFRLRRRDKTTGFRVPGHPFTTVLFVAICWIVVVNTIYRYPENTLIGLGILLAGIPAYLFWKWRNG